MNIIDELRERNLVKQVVFEEDLKKEFDSGMVSFYVGFDPTANSLTVGHFLPIIMARHLQQAGHRPIILVGGGTAMIGDPSLRTDMRKMLTREQIAENVDCIKKQLSRYISFEGKNGAILVNNADWLLNLNYIDFIRDIGSVLSVNKMLTAECFKTRLEKGLTFLEFNYMPMQAYDFLHLFQTYNCILEVGGDDQWSNMLAGADLIRRRESKPAYALTLPLLLKSDGTKMGKTASGALWLDENKSPDIDIFQYFRNVEDEKTEECLRMLTFLPIEKINELMKGNINSAKEVLAYEIVKLMRGEESAERTLKQVRASFSGDEENMPEIKIEKVDNVIDLLLSTKLVVSKSEARRLIENKGVKINENIIEDINEPLTEKEFVLHKGKKIHVKVIMN